MDAPQLKKQRIRSKNFTMSETEVLHSLVKEHMHVLSAKHCSGESGITKKMQDQIWELISSKVSSLGTAHRSSSEVKEKWRNMTKKAKTEVTIQKVHMAKTGGGPPAKLSNPVLEDIAAMYQTSAAFHGIPGAGDAETVLLSLPLELDDADESNIALLDIEQSECAQGASSSTDEHVQGSCQVTESATQPIASSSDTTTKTTTELPKRSMKSLKELQVEFFTAATRTEKEKFKFFNKLNEAMPKMTLLLDTLFSKTVGEE